MRGGFVAIAVALLVPLLSLPSFGEAAINLTNLEARNLDRVSHFNSTAQLGVNVNWTQIPDLWKGHAYNMTITCRCVQKASMYLRVAACMHGTHRFLTSMHSTQMLVEMWLGSGMSPLPHVHTLRSIFFYTGQGDWNVRLMFPCSTLSAAHYSCSCSCICYCCCFCTRYYCGW